VRFVRPVVLDPRITAAGFLDPDDFHGIYRLLGLFAYGRICQYLRLFASAEEDEARKQLGPRYYQIGRQGPGAVSLVRMADERRARLADLLPPATSRQDLVLASSVSLHDEVKLEIDRADAWGHYDEPELGLFARRVVGSITGVLVDGLGEHERRFRRIDQEMLVAAAQAGAMLVTQSESLAPEEWETFSRVAPGNRAPVEVCRLATFIDREVDRYPFDLKRDVPMEFLNVACRPIAESPKARAERLAG
jgi:hypothetical protein